MDRRTLAVSDRHSAGGDGEVFEVPLVRPRALPRPAAGGPGLPSTVWRKGVAPRDSLGRVTGSFLLIVVMPEATSSFLLRS